MSGFSCPHGICDGSGWTMREEDGYRIASRCRCLLDKITAQRLAEATRGSRIPTKYEDGRTFESYDATRFSEAHAAVKAWADNPVRWLVLSGSPGTGKTHLACAAVKVIEARRVAVAFVSVPAMLDSLRPSRDDDGSALAALQSVSVLALDDLGAHKETEWTAEVFFKLLDHRYMMDLPTLVTMNLDSRELAARPGWRRIIDRMIEKSIPVRMFGESYRKKIAHDAATALSA